MIELGLIEDLLADHLLYDILNGADAEDGHVRRQVELVAPALLDESAVFRNERQVSASSVVARYKRSQPTSASACVGGCVDLSPQHSQPTARKRGGTQAARWHAGAAARKLTVAC